MADGDFNLATFWIPVAPETSKVGPALRRRARRVRSGSVRGSRISATPSPTTWRRSALKLKTLSPISETASKTFFPRPALTAPRALRIISARLGLMVRGRWQAISGRPKAR